MEKISRIIYGMFYLILFINTFFLFCIFIYCLFNILTLNRELVLKFLYIFIGLCLLMIALLITDVILNERIKK